MSEESPELMTPTELAATTATATARRRSMKLEPVADTILESDDSAAVAGAPIGLDTNNKRVPLDTLARLFPQMKRNTLKSTLDASNGDVLKAIEQLVYQNSQQQQQQQSSGGSAGGSISDANANKRKSSDQQPVREKQTRYSSQHHHPSVTEHWKTSSQQQQQQQQHNLLAAAFPSANSSAANRQPIFPMQTGYFPTAFGYGTSAGFLAGNFLRSDYPVFPGMNLLAAGTGGGPASASLDPNYAAAAAAAAYHHHLGQLPTSTASSVLMKRESSPSPSPPPHPHSELVVGAMIDDHRSSPHSDRSEHSAPYSD